MGKYCSSIVETLVAEMMMVVAVMKKKEEEKVFRLQPLNFMQFPQGGLIDD